MDTRIVIFVFQISILYALVSCQNDNPRNSVKFVVECESPSDKSPSKLINVEVLPSQNNESSLIESEDNVLEPTYGSPIVDSDQKKEPNAENDSPSYIPDQDSEASKPNLFANSKIFPSIGGPSLLNGNYDQENNPVATDDKYGQESQNSDMAMSPSLAYPHKEETYVDDKGKGFLKGGLPNLLPTIFLPPLPIGGVVEEISSLIKNVGDIGRPDGGINGISRSAGGLPDILKNSNIGGVLQNPLVPQPALINPNGVNGLPSLLNRNSINPNGIQGNLGESLMSRLGSSNLGNVWQNQENVPTLSERLSTILNRNSNSGDSIAAATNNAIGTPRNVILSNIQNSDLGNRLQPSQLTLPTATNPSISDRLSSLLNRNSNTDNTAVSNDRTNSRDSILSILRNSETKNELLKQLELPSVKNSTLTEKLSTLLNRNTNSNDADAAASNNNGTKPRDSILSILRNSEEGNKLLNQLSLPVLRNSTLSERLSTLLNRNANSDDDEKNTNNGTKMSPLNTILSSLRNSEDGKSLLNQLALPALGNSTFTERLSTLLNRNANSDDDDEKNINNGTKPSPLNSILSILRNSEDGNKFLNQLSLPAIGNSTLTERLATLLNRNANPDDDEKNTSNGTKASPLNSILSILRNSEDGNKLLNQLSLPAIGNSTLTERLATLLNRNANPDDDEKNTSNGTKASPLNSILSILRNSEDGNKLLNQLSLPAIGNSTLTERLATLLNRNANPDDAETAASKNGIGTNPTDSILSILRNSDAGNNLLNQLVVPSLANPTLTERIATLLNRNANPDDAKTTARKNDIGTNPSDSILSILRNSDAGNALLNQLSLPSFTDSSLTEKLSTLLNRNANSNDAEPAASNNGIGTNPRDSILTILRNSNPESALFNSSLTEKLTSLLNRNSSPDNKELTASENETKTRDSILSILRNSDLGNSLLNHITMPFPLNSTLAERLSASLNRNSKSNDAETAATNDVIKTQPRDSILSSLRNFNLKTPVHKVHASPSPNSNNARAYHQKHQSKPISTPKISQEKILPAENKPKLIDLETSPTLLRSSVIKPPSSSINTPSLLNRNQNLNDIGNDLISHLPFNSNLGIPSLLRTPKTFTNEAAVPNYSNSNPIARNPTNRYHIENGILKPQPILKPPIVTPTENPPFNIHKPFKFQNPKKQRGQQINGKNFSQPQFAQGTNVPKPIFNMNPPSNNRVITPLDKLRNSMPDNFPQFSNMRTPNQIPPLPSLPEFPLNNRNTNPMNQMRSSMNEMFRNNELSETTNKLINGLTSGMGKILNTARGVSDVLKNSFDIPRNGPASLGDLARPDPSSALRIPFSGQSPLNLIRSNPISDMQASPTLQKPQFTQEKPALRQAIEDANTEFSQSQNYTEETCDICNCLMKYVPNDVVKGRFVISKPKSNSRLSLLKNIKKPFTLTRGRKNREDEDLIAMASELSEVYAPPPENFDFGDDQKGTNINDSLWDGIDANDGIKKLTDFLSVVDRVDQFVSEKTKLVIKRLTEMTKDEQNQDVKI